MEFEICVKRGNAVSSVLGDRGIYPPYGLHGGAEGGKAIVEYCLDGEKFFPEHVTKDENIQLKPGDTARIGTPGGGGWGNPFSRDPLRVLRDVQLEFVTLEDARKRYHVAIEKTDIDYILNIEETNNLRKNINFS
jgi:N-methylhydantoinase B